MTKRDAALPAHDQELFLQDVVEGLSGDRKTLPCKYFYDKRGSELFDAICEAEDYYPTRTEIRITRDNAREIAKMIGPRAAILELGSGSSLKTGVVLAALEDPVAYIPLDISEEHLEEAADRIREAFPHIPVHPLAADFHNPIRLPEIERQPDRVVAYFPGSTVGNFQPGEAIELLTRVAETVGEGGAMLIGVDLVKSPDVLERAYNDSGGVTAEFNMNLLRRINDELDADFDLDAFEHRAVWNEELSRIEMRLYSKADQTVRVGDRSFDFREGEHILTECSHKHTPGTFASLAARAGFGVERVWTDDRRLFSLQFLTVPMRD